MTRSKKSTATKQAKTKVPLPKKRTLAKPDARDAALLAWADDVLQWPVKKPALLRAAVSHRSVGSEHYQRLEFLGDRVLGLCVADMLLKKFPADSEGQLAKRFAQLVRLETCAAVGRDCGVTAHVRLDSTAASHKLQKSDNLLGDVCEALIGAMYLDRGMAVAAKFVEQHWRARIDGQTELAPVDPKSALQEWAQGRGLPLPDYIEIGRSGPDHAPDFEIEVRVQGFAPVRAKGRSKQEAQKLAAEKFITAVQA